jgi:hypothetical protein
MPTTRFKISGRIF